TAHPMMRADAVAAGAPWDLRRDLQPAGAGWLPIAGASRGRIEGERPFAVVAALLLLIPCRTSKNPAKAAKRARSSKRGSKKWPHPEYGSSGLRRSAGNGVA